MGIKTLEMFSDLKNPNADLNYKIIIPIPHLLTKAFMNLSSTDPYTVAQAFFEQMYNYDSQLQDQSKFMSEFIHII